MKQIWIIMVIVSFVSVLFGSFIMTAYGSPSMAICLATRLNGSEAPCPETNPIEFANFHGSALRIFSNLLVIDGSVLLFAVASLGIVMAGFLSMQASERNLAKLFVVSSVNSKSRSYRPEINKLAWLSLHENSPAYF